MADAEDDFRAKLARQSRSFEEAVAEYQRRYKRDPPKGFDDWYKFAVEKDVKLIDEFDAITEDLNPFWAFSGEELRRRVDQVSRQSIYLQLFCEGSCQLSKHPIHCIVVHIPGCFGLHIRDLFPTFKRSGLFTQICFRVIYEYSPFSISVTLLYSTFIPSPPNDGDP